MKNFEKSKSKKSYKKSKKSKNKKSLKNQLKVDRQNKMTFLGLTEASFYCFDLKAKWMGLETSVLDRFEWLDDYQDYLNETDKLFTDYTEFSEGHLTWDNYTHAYKDALCSCTCK